MKKLDSRFRGNDIGKLFDSSQTEMTLVRPSAGDEIGFVYLFLRNEPNFSKREAASYNLFLRNEPNFSVASRRSPVAPHRERNGLNPMQHDPDIGRGLDAEGGLICHTVNQR